MVLNWSCRVGVSTGKDLDRVGQSVAIGVERPFQSAQKNLFTVEQPIAVTVYPI